MSRKIIGFIHKGDTGRHLTKGKSYLWTSEVTSSRSPCWITDEGSSQPYSNGYSSMIGGDTPIYEVDLKPLISKARSLITKVTNFQVLVDGGVYLTRDGREVTLREESPVSFRATSLLSFNYEEKRRKGGYWVVFMDEDNQQDLLRRIR